MMINNKTKKKSSHWLNDLELKQRIFALYMKSLMDALRDALPLSILLEHYKTIFHTTMVICIRPIFRILSDSKWWEMAGGEGMKKTDHRR